MTPLKICIPLRGASGYEYKFQAYSFHNFDELNAGLQNTHYGGLYVFVRLVKDKFFPIYIGETGDFSTRYQHHHKEYCIMSYGANCIGLLPLNGNERQRKEMEKDLLEHYNLPCNEKNN